MPKIASRTGRSKAVTGGAIDGRTVIRGKSVAARGAPPAKEVTFGSLILCFTSTFELRWSDVGSGANADGAFYHPVPPAGFHALGSIGFGYAVSNRWPNGNAVGLCVKAANTILGRPALARPQRYEQIWDDRGSGAEKDGSCWRPVPPEGYVALGDVFVGGYAAPSLDDVMCVEQALVEKGVVGEPIWIDAGSGADRDFGAWQIEAASARSDYAAGWFAVNSFVGRSSHQKPGAAPVAWTLRLPLPSWRWREPAKPALDGRKRPAERTTPTVDRRVTLPCTGVIDNDYSLLWRIENSPVYEVEHSIYYESLAFKDNTTSRDTSETVAVATGVSAEQSKAFFASAGLRVSYDGGIEAGVFSTNFSAQLSLELGYTPRGKVPHLRLLKEVVEMRVPAGQAMALWVKHSRIRLVRSDETQAGASLIFACAGTHFFATVK